MDPQQRQPTKEEMLLKSALEDHGLRVLTQVKDGHKSVDLAIPSAKLNIEIDGEEHLTNPNQIINDLSRSHFSDGLGYQTIHIPNIFIRSKLEKVAAALAVAARIREKQINQSSPTQNT